MKKKIRYRFFAYLLIAVLSVSSFGVLYTVPVQAASSTTTLSASTLIGQILAKLGVYPNNDLLTGFCDSLGNVLYNAIKEREPAIENFVSSGASKESLAQMLGFVLKYNALTVPALTIEDMIKVSKEDELIVPDYVVDIIHDSFNDYLQTNADYWIVKTLKPSQIDPVLFKTRNVYDNFLNTVKRSNVVLGFYAPMDNNLIGSIFQFRNYDNTYIVASHPEKFTTTGENSLIFALDKNWSILPCVYPFEPKAGTYSYIDLATESFDIKTFEYSGKSGYDNWNYMYQKVSYMLSSLVSIDGRPVKIFRNETTVKRYSVGYQSYYYTTNYTDYDNSVDNSVTIKGNQYIDNSSKNYYEEVQNIVNNEYQENTNITEGDVTNIVNNYYQTIINGGSGGNSGGGSGGGGDSGGGSGGGGDSGGGSSIGDAIIAIVDGIGKILEVLLTVIGKVFGLLGTFFGTVLELLLSFGPIIGSLSTFMKDAFAFLPSEAIDAIVLGIIGIIAIGIVKAIIK